MGGVKEMWSIREEHINEWGSVLCGGRSRGGGGVYWREVRLRHGWG